MARPTRSERRARRELQMASAGAAAPPVVPPRPRSVAAAGEDQPRRVPGGRLRRFVIESWGELRKVDWPGQSQVIQGTAVVLIACIVVGFYLWVADQAFRHLVQDVFLK